ncbi:uncharacterized protein LOC115034090 [Acyrthosiphon pisum]|uniref:Uncharacterized protein n=1 Tax=Acyrthosiphon pisum TaxID=7029 RepID=A0A8R2JSQ8_ACYPI|nr:uncharacterized protein LOC115034090 [Acyrthosiphon pisum]
MAVNYNINAVNGVLLEILEEIIVGIMNGSYEDESDENIVPVVTFLLSAIGSDTTSSGDALSPGSEHSEPVDPTTISEEAPLSNTVREDDDTSVAVRVDEVIYQQ